MKKTLFIIMMVGILALSACAKEAAQDNTMSDQDKAAVEDASMKDKEVVPPAPAPAAEPAPTPAPTPTPTPKPAPTPPPAAKKTQVISMTANGFSPKEVTVAAGTTVTFVNNDTEVHWPASDVHPSHTKCPGFDAKGVVEAGKSYSFTFKDAKVCPLHDHLNPSLRGQITVTQ